MSGLIKPTTQYDLSEIMLEGVEGRGEDATATTSEGGVMIEEPAACALAGDRLKADRHVRAVKRGEALSLPTLSRTDISLSAL